MGISVVTGPSTEPVTLAEVKAHCRIDDTDSDGLLTRYILAARTWVEGQIHRPLVSRMYDYTIDWGWPDRCGLQWIVLPYLPLQAVRSINYVDDTGTTRTLSTSQYRVMTNRAKAEIGPAYSVTWPTVRFDLEAITVRFIAGYTNFTDTLSSPNYTVAGQGIPDDLVSAVLFLTAHMFENREAVSMGKLEAPAELPFGIEALISPYRSACF